jgi:hypothetical protein
MTRVGPEVPQRSDSSLKSPSRSDSRPTAFPCAGSIGGRVRYIYLGRRRV